MMDAPVSPLLVPRKRRLSPKTEDRILYAAMIIIAVFVVVLVCAMWLGLHALAAQPGDDAWVTWWASIWRPIVAIVAGIFIDLVLLVLLASKAYDD